MSGVEIRTNVSIQSAHISQNRVSVTAVGPNKAVSTQSFDHVIAATGYEFNVRRIPFLPDEILDRIETVDHSPMLSSNFESSVRNIFFAGPIAAKTFGPVMRFACGARYTARRLGKYLS
jgi:hypothetical protein